MRFNIKYLFLIIIGFSGIQCSIEKNIIIDKEFIKQVTTNQLKGEKSMEIPEVVIYAAPNFNSYEGFSKRVNCSFSYVGDYWNNNISSIIVVRGTWEFYDKTYYGGEKTILGPGYYPNAKEMGILDNEIGSFRCISWE